MDYFDVANELYKHAGMVDSQFTVSTPGQKQQEMSPMIGGAAAGGLYGVGKGFGKFMGPRTIANPHYVKGTPKTDKNFAEIGKKKVKNPFGNRVSGMSKRIRPKAIIGRGLIGAGIGALGGMAVGAMKDQSNFKLASDYAYFEKIASEIPEDVLLHETIRRAVENAPKRTTGPFLRDIRCEVCGYRGTPKSNGACPVCGAVLGIDPYKNYQGAQPYIIQEGPKDGVPVTEQAIIDDMEIQA